MNLDHAVASRTSRRSDSGILSWIGIVSELTKARITVAVTLSVATGHFIFVETLSASVLLPMLGVFLLACGSSALNEVQEARIDALMARTQARPIPSGRIGADWALFVALVFIGTAFYVLSCIEAHTLTILTIAALALVWYNGVYTLLKRWTAFAVVPGALVGALPPVIGWAAGGGLVSDPLIVQLAFFFFIWQVPHFWLLLLLYGEEYAAAGLPVLTKHFAPNQLRRITSIWIFAAAATGILIAMTEKAHLPWNLGILIASLWLGARALGVLRRANDHPARFADFMQINIYALMVMLFLIANALL